jgi:hypothetical protein
MISHPRYFITRSLSVCDMPQMTGVRKNFVLDILVLIVRIVSCISDHTLRIRKKASESKRTSFARPVFIKIQYTQVDLNFFCVVDNILKTINTCHISTWTEVCVRLHVCLLVYVRVSDCVRVLLMRVWMCLHVAASVCVLQDCDNPGQGTALSRAFAGWSLAIQD